MAEPITICDEVFLSERDPGSANQPRTGRAGNSFPSGITSIFASIDDHLGRAWEDGPSLESTQVFHRAPSRRFSLPLCISVHRSS